MPLLDASLITNTMENAKKLPVPLKKVEACTSLVPLLSKEEREHLLSEVEATLQKVDAIERVGVLRAWLPYLDQQAKQRVIQDILTAASAVVATVTHIDFEKLAWLVVSLEEALPEITDEFAEPALRLVLAPSLQTSRDQLLELLAPNLKGNLLINALNAVGEIDDQYARVVAISRLATQLTDPIRQQILQYGLNLLTQIVIPYSLSKAVATLAPLLEEQERKRVLHRGLEAARDSGLFAPLAFAMLAPHLTGELTQEALDTARRLVGRHPGSKEKALAALAARLTGEPKRRLIQEILDTLQQFDDSLRTDILSLLIPTCDGESLSKCWLAAERLTEPSLRVRLAAEIAPRLTDDDRDRALTEGEATAATITGYYDRAMATAILAEQLTGSARVRAIASAVEVVAKIDEPRQHASALARLLPLIAGVDKEKAVSEAFECLMKIDEFGKGDALERLVPRLAGEPLEHAATIAASLADVSARASALACVCKRWTQLAVGLEAQHAIRQRSGLWLFSLRYTDRSRILLFCAECLLNKQLLSDDALATIARYVSEITAEWHFEPSATMSTHCAMMMTA